MGITQKGDITNSTTQTADNTRYDRVLFDDWVDDFIFIK